METHRFIVYLPAKTQEKTEKNFDPVVCFIGFEYFGLLSYLSTPTETHLRSNISFHLIFFSNLICSNLFFAFLAFQSADYPLDRKKVKTKYVIKYMMVQKTRILQIFWGYFSKKFFLKT